MFLSSESPSKTLLAGSFRDVLDAHLDQVRARLLEAHESEIRAIKVDQGRVDIARESQAASLSGAENSCIPRDACGESHRKIIHLGEADEDPKLLVFSQIVCENDPVAESEDDEVSQLAYGKWAMIVESLLNQEDQQEVQTKRMMRRLDTDEYKRQGSMAHHNSRGWARSLAIDPGSRGRLVWEMIGLVLVVYDLLAFPFFAFFKPPKHSWRDTLDMASATYWLLDFPSQFFVGFHHFECLILRVPLIAKRYLLSWFVYDFSLLVLDWVFIIVDLNPEVIGGLRGFRAIRILRALRLLRAYRLASNESRQQLMSKEISATAFRLLRLLVTVAGVNHTLGCLWYGVGTYDWGENSSWVEKHFKEDLDNPDYVLRYAVSLHWSLCQFTPAGMEVHPQNKYERLFAIGTVTFGVFAFSSIVSSITSIMVQIRAANAAKVEQETSLRRYLHDNSVSLALSQRIWTFLAHSKRAHKKGQHGDDVVLLRRIPENLRIHLDVEIYKPSMLKHPLFEAINLDNSGMVCHICHDAMEHRVLGMGDVAFSHEEAATGMYVVASGLMRYSRESPSEDRVMEGASTKSSWLGKYWTKNDGNMVHPGSWVSEVALWMKWTHCGWFSSVVSSDVYHVSAAKLQHILQPGAKMTQMRSGDANLEERMLSERECRLACQRYSCYFKDFLSDTVMERDGGASDLLIEDDLEHLREVVKKCFNMTGSGAGSRYAAFRQLQLWQWAAATKSRAGARRSSTSIRDSQ